MTSKSADQLVPVTFWFHYNKPASRALGKPQITVHVYGRCMLVDNVKVDVPTYGRVRRTQPFFVLVGKARSFKVTDGVMVISMEGR